MTNVRTACTSTSVKLLAPVFAALALSACGAGSDSTSAVSATGSQRTGASNVSASENTVTKPDGTVLSPSQTLVAAQTSSCGKSSWFAGLTELCAGHLVYRDYVYDDYGADVGAVSPSPTSPTLLNLASREGQNGNPFGANNPGLLSPTAGDSRYPVGSENTADLVRLDISLQGSQVVAQFELNALYQPDQTIVALAIDTDNNPATGNKQLMGLTVKGADEVYEFTNKNAVVDVAGNLVTVRFALPAAPQWKVWAVTAQKDRTVMNVAFRGTQEGAGATGGIPEQVLPNLGNWWEDKQAAALMAKDISGFNAVVSTADLVGGVTRGTAVATGFHQRVYTSKYTVKGSTGEGMVLKGLPGRHGNTGAPCEQLFNYVGKYQPYGIYVPAKVNGSDVRGLQMVLHGCEANHASQVNQPGMQKQFGDEVNRILVAPLGRGPYGFYSDISERDVLDVYDDVMALFNIDDKRIFASGYSMGGYGASRLAALYPDRFAGLNNWVGFTGDLLNLPIPGNPLPAGSAQFASASGGALPVSSKIGAVGNVIDFMGNLLHIPSTHSYATADELVQVNTGLAWAQRLGETAGVVYDFFLHIAAEHLTLIALDDWKKEAAYTKDLKRVENPGRVVFRTDASLAYPEYGIKHDKAYWVSNVVGRGAGYIDIDASSAACGKGIRATETGQDGGNGPVPYIRTFRRFVGGLMAAPASNSFKANLKNVKALSIDVAGTCLGSGAAYEVVTDGPVTLSFSDGRVLNLPAAGTLTGRF